MTARLHHAALMGQLKSPGGISDAYDGVVPAGLSRWAKVWAPAGFTEQARFTGRHTAKTFVWTIHSVGVDVDSAMWVQERVLLKLENALLTVAGWNPHRITHPVSRPADIDESGSQVLHFLVDQFELYSEPVG